MKCFRSVVMVLLGFSCVLIVGLTSCTPSASLQSISSTYPSTDVEAVDYLSNVEQMRGELRAVRELIDLGYFDRLNDHLQASLDRPYIALNRRANWEPTFLISLFNFRDLVATKAFAQKPLLLAQSQRVNARLQQVSQSSALQKWRTLPVFLRVMEQQILQVGHLYTQAVVNGVIVNRTDFESARGLIASIQENLFQPRKNELFRINPILAGQMDTAISSILTAVPTVIVSGAGSFEGQKLEAAIAAFVNSSQQLMGVS